MAFLRLMMILALVPMTAWSGMPQIACRCSSGEIRLFCPKLRQSASLMNSGCCSSGEQQASCCATHSAGGCCGSDKKDRDQDPAVCGDTCHCTPVILAADASIKPKFENLPDVQQVEFLPLAVCAICEPLAARVDMSGVDPIPLVPDDLVVLTGRWLI